jgi:formylglycine-generating enzyme required for sulfatase activity
MTGNVWEWCQDWYGIYTAAGGKTIPDPRGPATGTKRVKRGGSWNRLPDYSRVSFRNYHTPQNSDRTLGFRVAMSAIK